MPGPNKATSTMNGAVKNDLKVRMIKEVEACYLVVTKNRKWI